MGQHSTAVAITPKRTKKISGMTIVHFTLYHLSSVIKTTDFSYAECIPKHDDDNTLCWEFTRDFLCSLFCLLTPHETVNLAFKRESSFSSLSVAFSVHALIAQRTLMCFVLMTHEHKRILVFQVAIQRKFISTEFRNEQKGAGGFFQKTRTGNLSTTIEYNSFSNCFKRKMKEEEIIVYLI